RGSDEGADERPIRGAIGRFGRVISLTVGGARRARAARYERGGLSRSGGSAVGGPVFRPGRAVAAPKQNSTSLPAEPRDRAPRRRPPPDRPAPTGSAPQGMHQGPRRARQEGRGDHASQRRRYEEQSRSS